MCLNYGIQKLLNADFSARLKAILTIRKAVRSPAANAINKFIAVLCTDSKEQTHVPMMGHFQELQKIPSLNALHQIGQIAPPRILQGGVFYCHE